MSELKGKRKRKSNKAVLNQLMRYVIEKRKERSSSEGKSISVTFSFQNENQAKKLTRVKIYRRWKENDGDVGMKLEKLNLCDVTSNTPCTHSAQRKLVFRIEDVLSMDFL